MNLGGVVPGESAIDIRGNASYTIGTFRKKEKGRLSAESLPALDLLKTQLEAQSDPTFWVGTIGPVPSDLVQQVKDVEGQPQARRRRE